VINATSFKQSTVDSIEKKIKKDINSLYYTISYLLPVSIFARTKLDFLAKAALKKFVQKHDKA